MRHTILGRLSQSFNNNWECILHAPLGELAGSLGDLGTLLPIMVAMTAAQTISLTSTLVFSGVWNVLSGTFFGVPIVVYINFFFFLIEISVVLTADFIFIGTTDESPGSSFSCTRSVIK
jgi:hypothetical protein